AERQQVGRLELGCHVGQAEPDPLEPPDRLAELHPASGPPGTHVEHSSGAPDARRRDRKPAGAEPFAQQVEPMSFGAEKCGARYAAVSKREVAVVITAVGYR